jgi:hypothetical protein
MAETPPNLRLHLEQRNGALRAAAQVAFGADGSLYLFPYAAGGEYWYGAQTLPSGQGSFEVKFRDQVMATARPKLSVHWSGDVHIYANQSTKAGPLKIPALSELRGEHIASVQFDHIERMPVYTRATKVTGEKIDVTFGVPDDVDAGRVLVYANGERNLFLTSRVHLAQRVVRQDGQEVWFGFSAAVNDPFGEEASGGVTVLAGFDARKRDDKDQEFLFLRGL